VRFQFSQDVRLGNLEGPQLSLDLDESGSGINTQLSSSPPNTGRASPTQPTTPAPIQEPMELQVDYWPMMRQIGDGKEKNQTKGQDQGKNSVKSTFRNLQVSHSAVACVCGKSLMTHSFQVWRLPLYPQTGELSNGMTLCFAAKEKKQKSK
jgi:phosphofurin acidic cluster sorting protein 2